MTGVPYGPSIRPPLPGHGEGKTALRPAETETGVRVDFLPDIEVETGVRVDFSDGRPNNSTLTPV
jgi:hypothetical protein